MHLKASNCSLLKRDIESTLDWKTLRQEIYPDLTRNRPQEGSKRNATWFHCDSRIEMTVLIPLLLSSTLSHLSWLGSESGSKQSPRKYWMIAWSQFNRQFQTEYIHTLHWSRKPIKLLLPEPYYTESETYIKLQKSAKMRQYIIIQNKKPRTLLKIEKEYLINISPRC